MWGDDDHVLQVELTCDPCHFANLSKVCEELGRHGRGSLDSAC